MVLESTFYPGVTEEIMGPISERESGIDKQTLETSSGLYRLVKNVHQAPDIKTAEAATGHSKMSSVTPTLPS
ncbi:MAG: hypothetical protein NTV68_05230 [Methanomicrobiales archaeon]|nr:hypothetical protein [Methanomicrobiales archaeon]